MDLETAPYIKRARIALVVVGVLYAWTAYGNYDHLRPWRDGSMFETEPAGELERLIDLAYAMIVVTAIASGATFVLAAIAGKKTMGAVYTATAMFAIYTALRLYQTDGRCVSSWLWWLTAIVIGAAFRAAYRANQVRRSRQLASARLVA